jgi:hypothetical protein
MNGETLLQLCPSVAVGRAKLAIMLHGANYPEAENMANE